MAGGQDLDRLGKLTVTRDPSVLVPIGADQVSQHPGITSIGGGAAGHGGHGSGRPLAG